MHRYKPSQPSPQPSTTWKLDYVALYEQGDHNVRKIRVIVNGLYDEQGVARKGLDNVDPTTLASLYLRTKNHTYGEASWCSDGAVTVQ